MSTLYCQSCAAERAFEYHPASGGTYCSVCGNVAEESGIVSEITFGESATGAAVVTGSYVGLDQTRAKLPSGRRPAGASGIESREQTIANGRRKIQQSIHSMKLPDRFVDVAQRWYTLALNSNFVRGRRTDYIIAACLYIVCRTEGTSHQLIDFSDELRVNVFVLGSTYLNLVRSLNMSIPTVDPSLYISRFASMLEFGEETQQVANDAIRLVQRFSRDWIDMGRRPAGVCGAALILAARMNNFRRSVEEVVQVVRIADTTLKKRLEEFGMTPSSQLTVTDFRAVTLNEEQDPPSYLASLRKERNLRDDTDGPPSKKRKVRFESDIESENDDDTANNTVNGTNGHHLDVSGQARFDDMFAEMDRLVNGDVPVPSPTMSIAEPPSFPSADDPDEVDIVPDEQDEEDLLDNFAEQEGALAEDAPVKLDQRRRASSAGSEGPLSKLKVDARTGQKLPPPDTRSAEERAADEAETAALVHEIDHELQVNPNFNILHQETFASQTTAIDKARAGRIPPRPRIGTPTTEDAAVAVAVNGLADPASASLSIPPLPLHPDLQVGQKGPIIYDEDSNAAQAVRVINAHSTAIEESPDLLDDLDEDELDDLILTEEEVRIKERLWMEFNKDYLANVAEKHLRAELDEKPLRKRERKKPLKPRDSSAPTADTAADATKQLLKQKKFSKKINYAAIDNLLGLNGDADGSVGGNPVVGSLFEEEAMDGERNNPWEASSQRSRASSVASSIGASTLGGTSTLGRKSSKKRPRSDVADSAAKLRAKLSKEPFSGATPPKQAKRQQRKTTAMTNNSKIPKPNNVGSPKKKYNALPQTIAEAEPAPAVAAADEDADEQLRPPANDEEEFAQLMARVRGDNEDEDYE